MSCYYKDSNSVPNRILSKRLDDLADIIINRKKGWQEELSMRVPAECDRDADLILSEADFRITEMSKIIMSIKRHIDSDDFDFEDRVIAVKSILKEYKYED